jgi:hypothetical protein
MHSQNTETSTAKQWACLLAGSSLCLLLPHSLISNIQPNDQCLKQAVTTTDTAAKVPVADTQLIKMGQHCIVPILR